MTQRQMHSLSLVYPSITNQEAEWLKDNDEVKEYLEKSNLYFICQHKEMNFIPDDKIVKEVPKIGKLSLSIKLDNITSKFSIDLQKIINMCKEVITIKDIEIKVKDKIFQIFYKEKLLYWATTNKVLHDKSKNCEFITGLDDYMKFNRYKILYIGISKKDNAFNRLVVKPHDTRLRILSNEHSLLGKSRLTDEITLFFFKLNNAFKVSIGNISTFLNDGAKFIGTETEIISDAEKAFIKVLNTKYNKVKYENYPKSKDGLDKYKIDGYLYIINESYLFETDNNKIITGNFSKDGINLENKADLIYIENESVKIIPRCI